LVFLAFFYNFLWISKASWKKKKKIFQQCWARTDPTGPTRNRKQGRARVGRFAETPLPIQKSERQSLGTIHMSH
jgi:hypothetical protein